MLPTAELRDRLAQTAKRDVLGIKILRAGRDKAQARDHQGCEAEGCRKELRDRLKKIDDRKIGAKVPLNQLLDLQIADLRRHGHDILIPLMRINKHLKDRPGSRESSSIGKPDVTEYMDDRLAAGAKKATINRELSIIAAL